MDFKNKVVVITGGATGIGFGLAKALGDEGANLVIASRRQDVVAAAVTQLQSFGYNTKGTTCDVSKRESIEALADFSWREFGCVDVIINNAGVSPAPKPIFEIPREEIESTFDINYYGVLNGVQVFGRRFLEQGTPCAIYNIASENAFFNAIPQTCAYVSTKHALKALTKALREEAPDYMQIALLCPGFVESEMTEGFPCGMPANEYADIVVQQLKMDKFYVVSHAYNMKRITDDYDEVRDAFSEFAPRYEGDSKHDGRTILKSLSGT